MKSLSILFAILLFSLVTSCASDNQSIVESNETQQFQTDRKESKCFKQSRLCYGRCQRVYGVTINVKSKQYSAGKDLATDVVQNDGSKVSGVMRSKWKQCNYRCLSDSMKCKQAMRKRKK